MATVMAMCVKRLRRRRRKPKDKTGITWHFIPMCRPLTEPGSTKVGFAGPWTREHYGPQFLPARRRDASRMDVPLQHRRLQRQRPDGRETVALMAAIDQVQARRPRFVATTARWEGRRTTTRHPGADQLYPQLTALCEAHGVPLHRGDPEDPAVG